MDCLKMMDLWLFRESQHFQLWDFFKRDSTSKKITKRESEKLSNNLIIPPFIIEGYIALYLYNSCPILIGSLIEYMQ